MLAQIFGALSEEICPQPELRRLMGHAQLGTISSTGVIHNVKNIGSERAARSDCSCSQGLAHEAHAYRFGKRTAKVIWPV